MMLVIVLWTAFTVASCEKIEFSTSLTGQAKATPSTVKNGDVIKLSVGGISASGSTTINGKEYYPIVHYLIDGKEVAVSNGKTLPFEVSYTVEGLSVGKHTLSANITPSLKGAEFENKVSNSEITVVQ